MEKMVKTVKMEKMVKIKKKFGPYVLKISTVKVFKLK